MNQNDMDPMDQHLFFALISILSFVHVQHAVVLVRLRLSDKKGDQLHDNDNLHRNFSERGDFGAHFHTYLCR